MFSDDEMYERSLDNRYDNFALINDSRTDEDTTVNKKGKFYL